MMNLQTAFGGVFDNMTPDFEGMLSKVVAFVFTFIGVASVFIMIIAGFNMMTSVGDPGKVKKAKNSILWCIIGLVVSVLAGSIISFVLSSLGL